MRRMDPAERRARLVERQRLAPSARGGTLEDVAESLIGLHSSDPVTVFLAARARLRRPAIAAIEHELYESRRLVRMHGMRRTLFVVPRRLAPIIHAGASLAIAAAERKRVVGMIGAAGIAEDPVSWLADVEECAFRALGARGVATTRQLGEDEPRLRIQVRLAVGKRYEGNVGVSTRLLFLMAMEGRIARGRPVGSWISSQYRWIPIEALFPGGYPALDPGTARVEIVRAWLAGFGPGTLADLRWWTGWTAAEVRRILAELWAVEVDLDGVTGFLLPDDDAPALEREPFAAFLPGLDPTVMGWSDRAFYLGDHARRLFDTNGNAGPTVWWGGRVVGGWGQRPDGGVVHRVLEDVGPEARAAIDAEAADLQAWMGPAAVTPRFRTPLERELVG